MKKVLIFCALSGVFIVGCKTDQAEPAPEVSKSEPSVAPDEKLPAPDEPEDEIPPEAFEQDPSATSTVERVDEKSLDLESFPNKRQRKGVFGWTDKYGTNAVVITAEQRGKNGAGLIATHARQEGDGSWTVVRELKEVIDTCEFDLILKPVFGDWSVTDLDEDGLGEATFGWNADCVSDVSPTTLKLFVIEDGEKYTLRGHTKVEDMGGEFKVDPDFAKAPKGFQAHAEKSWAAALQLPSY